MAGSAGGDVGVDHRATRREVQRHPAEFAIALPRDQRRQRLRTLADRLAVEARQVGADDTEIRAALDQALAQLNRKRS